MRFGLAVKGDLKRYMDDEATFHAEAMTDAVDDTVGFAKQSFRDQATGADLGRKLANSFRGQRYPTQGKSAEAAGIVWSNADAIVAGFSGGDVIRSSEGFYLAIPTESAPKRGDDGKRISPSNFPEWKWGPLKFVYRPNGKGLLVVENARASISRKTGNVRGFRPASKRARKTGVGLTTVVMFHLVPQVRLRKAFNIKRVEQQSEARFLSTLGRKLTKDE